MKIEVVYYARGTDALSNGSFYRRIGKRIARYINGDYMGDVKTIQLATGLGPEQAMSEFSRDEAEELIPEACGGKR